MTQYTELPKRLNFAGNLLFRNEKRVESPAFIFQNETITYKTVRESVRRAASYLRSKGIEREQRLAIILPNTPAFVAFFLAAIWMGAVSVPIHPDLSIEEMLYILSDCRAKHIVIDASLCSEIFAKKSSLRDITTPIDDRWKDLLSNFEESLHPEDTSRDEPAYWLYTSGTTSTPKGVIHLHHDPLIIAESYAKRTLALGPQDRVYATSSMAFAYGLGSLLYMPMYVGAVSILVAKSDILRFPEVIEHYKPTHFFSVPAFFSAGLELDRLSRPFDFSSVAVFVSAGEQLSKALGEAWQNRFKIPILDALGTTEVSHIFIANRPGDYRIGSIGKPIPGFSVIVKSETGDVLGPHQTGLLWVAGDSLMAGYWDRHEETIDLFCGRYLCTKDLVYYDEDGFFWYVGRSDSLFKVQGKWVVPSEIEEALLKHPAILEVAVTEMNKGGLNQVGAYLVLRKEFDPSLALHEISLFARKNLLSHQIPKNFILLDSFPRTANGKVKKNKLSSQQPREMHYV